MQELYVPADGLDAITLRLAAPSGWINGLARQPDGQPFVGGLVLAWDEANSIWASARTDATGAYTLPVVTGTWRVSVSPAISETDWLTAGLAGIAISAKRQQCPAVEYW